MISLLINMQKHLLITPLSALEGLAAVVNRVTCSAPVPGSNPLCTRLSPPRCLTCSWACRVSSGPWGIVVVRASWPGHPTLIKKKKKKKNTAIIVSTSSQCQRLNTIPEIRGDYLFGLFSLKKK